MNSDHSAQIKLNQLLTVRSERAVSVHWNVGCTSVGLLLADYRSQPHGSPQDKRSGDNNEHETECQWEWLTTDQPITRGRPIENRRRGCSAEYDSYQPRQRLEDVLVGIDVAVNANEYWKTPECKSE